MFAYRHFLSWALSSALVFTFGSAEKGQLGNGTTGERITTGNKTAFDIEPSPSKSPSSFLYTYIYTPSSNAHSLREGIRCQEYHSDCIGPST